MADPDPAAEIEHLALKLLGIREHSRLELARKLKTRGYAADAIEAVLTRLADRGALDEARLAAAYIAERAGKGFGPLRIRAELRDKGLMDATIARFLDTRGDEWPARLEQAHARRFGQGPPTDQADYGRRGRFLEQRGFPTELIRRHLSRKD